MTKSANDNMTSRQSSH